MLSVPWLLKSAEEVTLTVATTSQLPSSVVVAQTYSWVTPDGRPTSPPPEYNPRLHHHQVSRVEVEVVGSESLGLMIRGGVEYGLGIFITGVDEESAAHKAGLQVGDQILEVNKESFLAVTHDTAVNVLKYSRRLRLALRRVGKVPHSCTTYDRRCWPSQTKTPTPCACGRALFMRIGVGHLGPRIMVLVTAALEPVHSGAKWSNNSYLSQVYCIEHLVCNTSEHCRFNVTKSTSYVTLSKGVTIFKIRRYVYHVWQGISTIPIYQRTKDIYTQHRTNHCFDPRDDQCNID
nr:whirlin-like [Penaeus vannamei]